MKKAISYLYREILLKVDEKLEGWYTSEYEYDARYKEPIEDFRSELDKVNIQDAKNFDEKLLKELYEEATDESWIEQELELISDIKNDLRYGDFHIGDEIDEGASFYPSREVGIAITGLDSYCLGWTYYFGGGDYGCPDEVEWVEDCYLLKVREVEETRIVKIYEKIEK